MKRLKALRTAHKLTQADVATKLETNRQNVAKWESGKAKPSLSVLRDLATLFATSVDDLLEVNPFSERIITNSYHLLLQEDSDGFWGHLGLLQPGETKTKWYPITEAERQRLWLHLHESDDDDWLIAATLNNRILAFRPARMKRVWLLDDACDEPEGDWDWEQSWDDYSGLPKELYRAMSDCARAQRGEPADFSENNSETLQEIAIEMIAEAKLTEKPEEVLAVIHNTTIWLLTGDRYNYEVEPDKLWEAIQEIELGPRSMLHLPAFGGDFESFFSSSEVAMLDMPLIDVEDAVNREREEQERAA